MRVSLAVSLVLLHALVSAAEAASLSSYIPRTASAIAKGAAKATGFGLNAAVGALRPTHVDLAEILTNWRINQEVSVGRGRQTISCPATVQFRKGGKVLTRYEDEEFESNFKFKQRKWPRHCTIEFEARAFQGPYDEKPVTKLYKGKFQRSLLNPSLITIKGKVYEPVSGSRQHRPVRCGTFTATRRPLQREHRLVDDSDVHDLENLDDNLGDHEHVDVYDDNANVDEEAVEDDNVDGDDDDEFQASNADDSASLEDVDVDEDLEPELEADEDSDIEEDTDINDDD